MKKRALQFIFEYAAALWLLGVTGAYLIFSRTDAADIGIGFVLLAVLIAVCSVLARVSRNSKFSAALHIFGTTSVFSLYIFWCVATIVVSLLLLTFPYHIIGIPLWHIYTVTIQSISSIFLVYAAALVSVYSIGSVLLRKMRSIASGTLEHTLYALSLGMVATAVFFYGAALLHMLNASAVQLYAGLVALIILVSCRTLATTLFARRISYVVSPDLHDPRVLRTLIFAYIVFFLILAFVSVAGFHPLNSDDIRTYYNVPKTFVEQQGIVTFPYDPFNNAPHAFAYLYAPLIIIGPQFLNHIGSFFFILAMLALLMLGRRLYDERAAVLSILFFATIPWAFWFLTTVKVDFLVTFLILLAVYGFFRYFESRIRSWLLISGMLFGFAVSVKYTALLVVPALAVVFVVDMIRSRRSAAKAFSPGLVFFCSAAAVYAVWGLRMYILWGNPLYPFSAGGEYFLHTISNEHARQVLDSFLTVVHQSGAYLNKTLPWWKNLWYLGINRSAYVGNEIGPLFLGLLPLLLLRPEAATRKTTWRLLIVVAGTIAVWQVVVISQVWYMMFIFPLWALLSASCLRRVRTAGLWATIAGVSLFLALLQINTTRLFMVRVFAGVIPPRTYLSAYGSRVELAEYFNTQVLPHNPNYLVFPMGQQRQILFKDNFKHIYGLNNVLGQWIVFASEEPDAAAIRDVMRRRGITYVYYVYSDMEQFKNIWCPRGSPETAHCTELRRLLTRFDELATLLPVVARGDDWVVYAL